MSLNMSARHIFVAMFAHFKAVGTTPVARKSLLVFHFLVTNLTR